MKRKSGLYITGFIFALISFIPPIPDVLKLLIAGIPLVFFAVELLFGYMQKLANKSFINEYACVLLGCFALTLTGDISYAAIAAILCSAALYYFNTNFKSTVSLFEEICSIVPKRAMVMTEDGIRPVPIKELQPAQIVVVKTGDIIPADGIVVRGYGVLDYTNLFGPCQAKEASEGSKCFSGGIVTSGKLAIECQRTADNCLAGTMESRTRAAYTPSPMLRIITAAAKIFEPVVIGLALIMLIALFIATKEFAYSANIAAVILFAAPAVGILKIVPMLYSTSVLGARRRGSIFASTHALERFSKIQTISLNEKVSPETLEKIEESGIIPARNGSHTLDSVCYRSKEALEAADSEAFKIALGFFSDKADMTIFDGNIERAASAVRISRNFKNVMWENIAVLIIEKLALIALVFLLNITPAIAIAAEFAAWMICMFNASRITNILMINTKNK